MFVLLIVIIYYTLLWLLVKCALIMVDTLQTYNTYGRSCQKCIGCNLKPRSGIDSYTSEMRSQSPFVLPNGGLLDKLSGLVFICHSLAHQLEKITITPNHNLSHANIL